MISWNKISVIAFCLLIPLFGMGQGKVTRTNPKPDPVPTPIRTKSSSISVKLATDLDGVRKYYSVTEWSRIPITERIKHNKLGVVIESGKEKFLIALNNCMSNGIYDKGVSQMTALNKTQGNLPTSDQLWIITRNLSKINFAMTEFGGEIFCKQPYWAKSGSHVVQVDLGNNGLNKPNDGMFRICSIDIEKGFEEKEVICNKNEKYDYYGVKSNSNIQVIRHKDKYGFVREGEIIVPIEYDEVGYNYDWQNNKNGNDDIRWDYSVLMSVSKNGKWGFINKTGKLVTPLIFDSLDDMSSYDNTPVWVCKEGRYGCVDTLGVILPGI